MSEFLDNSKLPLEKVVQVVKKITDNNVLESSKTNIEPIDEVETKKELQQRVDKAMDETKYREEKSEKEINNKDAEYTEKQQEDKEKRNEKEEQEREERERNMKNKVSVLIILEFKKTTDPIENEKIFITEKEELKKKFNKIYNFGSKTAEVIENIKKFIHEYKKIKCDITFCGSYGDDVIYILLLLANLINNQNNNYFFSFMGTRFLEDDLFATQIPSPCNIYSSFKNSNSKEIVKVEESIPKGKSFDNNIQNHKYWIGKYIEIFKTLKLLNKDKEIKIKILDYKGNPIFEPNSKRQLEVDIELPSNSLDARANLPVKEKLGSIDGKPNIKVKEKLGSILGFPNFRKSKKGKGVGGKNRKTRKIKAKKTRKFRVKKPRKRSLR
jgi:hypothetical protein